jgi:hypothetical protein
VEPVPQLRPCEWDGRITPGKGRFAEGVQILAASEEASHSMQLILISPLDDADDHPLKRLTAVPTCREV